MIYSIFDALEKAISASLVFANFKIFRFENQANANQQSKASAPYIKIWFQQVRSVGDVKRHRMQKIAEVGFDLCWNLTKPDKNAIERMQEYSAYENALCDAIFGSNGVFLGIEGILNWQLSISPAEVIGTEALKQGKMEGTLNFEYIEAF